MPFSSVTTRAGLRSSAATTLIGRPYRLRHSGLVPLVELGSDGDDVFDAPLAQVPADGFEALERPFLHSPLPAVRHGLAFECMLSTA